MGIDHTQWLPTQRLMSSHDDAFGFAEIDKLCLWKVTDETEQVSQA